MEWFASWFDSEYYHLLYQHRNDTEAADFIRALHAHLQENYPALAQPAHVLDLACGKGRHTRQLAELYPQTQVLGVDLSPQSIQTAQNEAHPQNCQFAVHDLRQPLYGEFELIANLFTSFGYFEDEASHLLALENMRDALAPEGVLVIDFFNARPVVRDLVLSEQKTLSGVHFGIQRRLENGRLLKDIRVQPLEEAPHQFREQVWAFGLADFERFFEKVGLRLQAVFGDYQLRPFSESDSPRCLMLVQKK